MERLELRRSSSQQPTGWFINKFYQDSLGAHNRMISVRHCLYTKNMSSEFHTSTKRYDGFDVSTERWLVTVGAGSQQTVCIWDWKVTACCISLQYLLTRTSFGFKANLIFSGRTPLNHPSPASQWSRARYFHSLQCPEQHRLLVKTSQSNYLS